jgi:hypothetical protein
MLKMIAMTVAILAAAAPDGCAPAPTGSYPGAVVPNVAVRCVPPADTITWYGTVRGDHPGCEIHPRITSDVSHHEWTLSDPATCEYVATIDGEEQLILNNQKLVTLDDGQWWCGPYQNDVTLGECPYSFAPCQR